MKIAVSFSTLWPINFFLNSKSIFSKKSRKTGHFNVLLCCVDFVGTCHSLKTREQCMRFAQLERHSQSRLPCSKSTMETPQKCAKSVQSYQERYQNDVMSSLLTLNRFHTLGWFLHCRL